MRSRFQLPPDYDELVHDVLAIKSAERQLGRKLTDEEIHGFIPVPVMTDDGVKANLMIEKIPISFFFPDGARK